MVILFFSHSWQYYTFSLVTIFYKIIYVSTTDHILVSVCCVLVDAIFTYLFMDVTLKYGAKEWPRDGVIPGNRLHS